MRVLLVIKNSLLPMVKVAQKKTGFTRRRNERDENLKTKIHSNKVFTHKPFYLVFAFRCVRRGVA
jgi:hypothetical protein